MLRPDHSQLLPDSGAPPLGGGQPRHRSRFHDVLWAAGILLIVVMAAFQVYDVLRRLEIVVETEQHRFLNLVRALGEQTANTLQTVDVLLREAVDDGSLARLQRDSGAIEARLRARIAGLPQIVSLTIEQVGTRSVALTALDAQALASSQRGGNGGKVPPMPGLYIYDSPQRAGQGPGTIAVARSVHGKNGEVLGMAVADVSLEYFQRFYSGLDLGPGSAVTLFRVGGGAIAHFPAQRRAEEVAAEVALLQGLLAPGRAAVAMLPGPADGRERIFAVQPVPGFGLAVGASVEKAAVLAPWYVQAMHSAVRTTLLCLSVALLMWLVLRQLRSRERAEQRLLVQTALLDELFESAPEAIVMVDRQQRVTRVNREFTTMFGYSAEESQGRTLEELIVPEDLRSGHGSAAAAGGRAHDRGDRTGAARTAAGCTCPCWRPRS